HRHPRPRPRPGRPLARPGPAQAHRVRHRLVRLHRPRRRLPWHRLVRRPHPAARRARRVTGARPMSPKPCGTRAAYERHRRQGEPIDDACREANAAYHRKNARGRAYRRARQRAYTRLALTYSTAYRALLEEELAKEKDYR